LQRPPNTEAPNNSGFDPPKIKAAADFEARMALICTGSASQSTSATARCVHGKELVTDFFKPKQNWIDWEAGLLQQLLNCFERFKSRHYVFKKNVPIIGKGFNFARFHCKQHHYARL
jgi:hypothetical protein